MTYAKQLMDSIRDSLYIYPAGEGYEQYKERILYSALSEWVRTLVYGDSNRELGTSKIKTSVDIRFVQYHLTEIANAFIDLFHIPDDWFDKKSQNQASHLASSVIKDMVFTGNIAQIHDRLYPVPLQYYQCYDGIFLAAGDTVSKNTLYITAGTGKWRMVSRRRLEKDVPVNLLSKKRIINIPAKDYYNVLEKEMPWQNKIPDENFQIFESGSRGRYSQCWIDGDLFDIPQGLSLIRTSENFVPVYSLLRRKNNVIETAELDSWYRETKEYYRILYALNFRRNTPAGCTVKHIGKFYYLKLWSRLPDFEQRLLMNCSWPVKTYDNMYERFIPDNLWCVVEEILTFLGIHQ